MSRRNSERRIVVEVSSTLPARLHDLPATLIVMLAGVPTEMQYRHHSTALAAAKRIARELGLWKIPARHCWRSKT